MWNAASRSFLPTKKPNVSTLHPQLLVTYNHRLHQVLVMRGSCLLICSVFIVLQVHLHIDFLEQERMPENDLKGMVEAPTKQSQTSVNHIPQMTGV